MRNSGDERSRDMITLSAYLAGAIIALRIPNSTVSNSQTGGPDHWELGIDNWALIRYVSKRTATSLYRFLQGTGTPASARHPAHPSGRPRQSGRYNAFHDGRNAAVQALFYRRGGPAVEA